VKFGFTGLASPGGIDKEKLDACVPQDGGPEEARRFWWATILRAVELADDKPATPLQKLLPTAKDVETREDLLGNFELASRGKKRRLLVVYDALDTVAIDWPRRRLLTQALFEVVWALRAYSAIRPKLFLRPDQLDDDAFTFGWRYKSLPGVLLQTYSTALAAGPAGRQA
jgi:hypothetical protein